MRAAFVVLAIALCAAAAAQQCKIDEDERLSCFGWWKWDTPDMCVERGCCSSKGANADAKWCYYGHPRTNYTTVYVIQGCHLDVGFANTAQNIVNLWFDEHLPRAATVGRA